MRDDPGFTTKSTLQGLLLLRILQVMYLLAVYCNGFRIFELLDVLGRQLQPAHLDRQLVELGGQRKRRLVVR